MMPKHSSKSFNYYSLLIILFSVLSFPGYAVAFGFATSQPVVNRSTNQLVGYWDLRDRDSYFQVTNTIGENIRIHIQLYNVGDNCSEYDYYDTLTAFDTHTYNLDRLDRNNKQNLASPDFSGGHGIVAISNVNPDNSLNTESVLTGNFRIIDSAGYEYRTNFAGTGDTTVQASSVTNRSNFNTVGGTIYSDLVVISYNITDNPGGIIPTSNQYGILMYDENEQPISCPPIILGCPDQITQYPTSSAIIDTGINQGLTNSKGGPSLCLGNETTGYIEIYLSPADLTFPVFTVVYTGLNNGSSMGSMNIAHQFILPFGSPEIPDLCEINPDLCNITP